MSSVAHMAEIDLIPNEYRHERALRRAVRISGFAVLGLVVAAGAASATLRGSAARIENEIAQLKLAAAAVDQQRAAIESLRGQKLIIESRSALITKLRNQAHVDELIASIARAIPKDGAWFRSWRLVRNGTVVAQAPDAAEALVVVDPTAAAAHSALVRFTMTVTGEAAEHSAVTDFVQALFRVPLVRDVQVHGVSREGDAAAFVFDLTIVADVASTSL
jgi:Tfp pilus assembly protein PilN